MGPKPKVLIADDEPFNVDFLEQELEELNYDTLSAGNGEEALTLIRSQAPDLVLLDIMMPVMDGFAVLAHMKADPTLRNIPVIIISAMNDLESVVKGIEYGAEDYLSKPFEPVLLQARLSSSLEKKRLRDEQRRLIRTFTDRDVAEELIRQGFSLGGKYTHISAMYTDIRNFTTITEANDPADIIHLINQYYLIVIDAVQSHGGNVNQLQGDGLLSYFGAPVSYPDQAVRAVQSALEISRKVSSFNEEQAKSGGLQIKIGTGIATGRVVAGYVGTPSRASYLCVGDPINLSSRLEGHTKVVNRPIVIDEATCRELNGAFPVQWLGEETFKGKTIPVTVYSVTGADLF